jgi:hypothetical protein
LAIGIGIGLGIGIGIGIGIDGNYTAPGCRIAPLQPDEGRCGQFGKLVLFAVLGTDLGTERREFGANERCAIPLCCACLVSVLVLETSITCSTTLSTSTASQRRVASRGLRPSQVRLPRHSGPLRSEMCRRSPSALTVSWGG